MAQLTRIVSLKEIDGEISVSLLWLQVHARAMNILYSETSTSGLAMTGLKSLDNREVR